MLRTAPLALAALLVSSSAVGGGLDIPMLYTARHAGMGGTALAHVEDPSAVYHNPAGLSGIDSLSVLGDLSVFVSNQQTSPDYPEQHLQTGTRVGPAPFLGAGYRLHEMFSAGLATYPLGAVGGTFEYDNAYGTATLNEQQALALEISPALAFVPVPWLRFGAGYRITMLDFDRRLGPADDPSTVDIDTFGTSYDGFRLGMQLEPSEYFELGVAYRHPVTLTATADRGRLLGQELTDVRGTLAVPGKVGAGARVNVDRLSLAVDYELVQNTAFDRLEVGGTLPAQGTTLEVPFEFNWDDSSTIKVGVEGRPVRGVALRAGYAWDERFVNAAYPNTFSSPATDAHYLSFGGGYDAGDWQLNVAFMHRFEQSRYLEEQEIASREECPFCGSSGSYASRLSALFIDFGMDFDLTAEKTR